VEGGYCTVVKAKFENKVSLYEELGGWTVLLPEVKTSGPCSIFIYLMPRRIAEMIQVRPSV
jgi:hypothetical protein